MGVFKMTKNYMDMVQMLDDEMVEIANSGQLEDYIKENFSKWAINYNGANTYVYICDEEMDSVFEESVKAYMVLMLKNKIDLGDVLFTDLINFNAIEFARLSEAYLDEEIFEKDENGKIMYWGFSDSMTEFVECFVK